MKIALNKKTALWSILALVLVAAYPIYVWAAITNFERQPTGTPVAGDAFILTFDDPAQKGITISNETDSDEPVYIKLNDSATSPIISESVFSFKLLQGDYFSVGPNTCLAAKGIATISVLCDTTPTLVVNGWN